MTPTVISRIERGNYNDDLSLTHLFAIAHVLNLDPTVLIHFDDYEKSLWKKYENLNEP